MDMPRVLVFDHLDNRVCELSPNDVFELTRTEEINGANSLEITSTHPLEKEQRVLVRDMMGLWREYVVVGVDEAHLSGNHATGTYFCEWSLKHDLLGVVVEDKRPGAQTPVMAAAALEALLSCTLRWAVGVVTVTTTGGTTLYWVNAWEGLGKIVDEWGGEVRADITVSSSGVISRKLSLLDALGEQTAKRRFDFGYDLTGIQRRVEEEPLFCRVYPRGKGEETESGGYGRRITIEDANDGVPYLENAGTAQAIRLPDGQGGYEYPSCVIVNDQIEKPSELKEWGESVLDDYTTPKVTYTGTVEQFGAAGMSVKGVSLGDAVQCADRCFTPDAALRVNGRVVKVVVDERDPKAANLTIGYVSDGLSGLFSSLGDKVALTARLVEAMNGGTMTTDAYLSRLLDRLNAEINATGGYWYMIPGQGTRTYDKAVSDPSSGAEASQVVEIKGGTIRIANAKTSQGEWDWRSVFTAGHIAAEMITVANIIAGFIGSPAGNYWNLDTGVLSFDHGIISTADGSSFWNMTTGEVSLAPTAVINGTSAGDITSDIASLKLTAQQFSVDMQSTSETISSLQATYATCSTAGGTAAKAATCSGFELRSGAIVAVKFTNANTAANPTLNVNSTGAKPIQLNGSALPESAYWAAGQTVTFVYNGSAWTVADGSTAAQAVTNKTDIASLKLTAQQFSVDMQSLSTRIDGTDENVSNLSLRADGFDVSVKGMQATYGTCTTAGATQTKVVTIANFTKYTGQTVVVKFNYANTAAEPILKVQNSGGDTYASGYIYVNNAKMAPSYYWAAMDTLTLVWDGSAWRVADGGTVSRIKVLKDSITLSVSDLALGSSASIVMSVGGDEVTNVTADLSKVRNAFANDSSAITISAGTITFNSNTFVVNSDNFSVTNTGVITATSGTIGGFTIGLSQLYSGTNSMTSTAQGVYLGLDGISSASSTERVQLKDGDILGYQGTTLVGRITPTATVEEVSSSGVKTGTIWRGMQVRGQVFDIRVPHLAVLDRDAVGENDVSYLTRTESVTIGELGGISSSGNCLNVNPKSVAYRIIHGMLVSYDTTTYGSVSLATKTYVDNAVDGVSSPTFSLSNGVLTITTS